MCLKLGDEPVAIIGIVVTVLNAVQAAAVAVPSWTHAVVLVVTIAGGVVLQRRCVTPLAKLRKALPLASATRKQ